MKTYVKSSNGKRYQYVYADLHIAKGKSIRKSTSLGPVESQAKSNELEGFIEKLKSEEALRRFQYWSNNIRDSKFTKYSPIEKIEKWRANLIWNIEKIGELAKGLVETEFQIEFIVNSNQLEGSNVPRKTAEEQIMQPAKKIDDESKNAVKAIYFVSTSFRFGPLLHIKELQKLLLAHEPQSIGLRTEDRVVANSKVLAWAEIKRELRHFLDQYKHDKKSVYPPKLAFDFYYFFERIHPFLDGNGRTGRLMMNRILQDNGYPPMIIWNQNRAAHMNAFEKRMDGKPEYFYKFMINQMIKSYKFFQQKLNDVHIA